MILVEHIILYVLIAFNLFVSYLNLRAAKINRRQMYQNMDDAKLNYECALKNSKLALKLKKIESEMIGLRL